MIYIKKWFEYYDELFRVEENQQDFIENICKAASSPKKLLSVECGPGTISKRLAKNDYEVTVTDSFPESINCINNNQNVDKSSLHAFNLVPQDIGRYLGKNFFDIIICCNYRLIFMNNKALITKFLVDCKQLLKDGGSLVLDLINFSKYDFSEDRIDLPQKSCERATLYSYLVKNKETAAYNLNQYVITSSGKRIDEVVNHEVSPVSLETFKKLAEELQLKSEFFSNYKGTPYKADSDKIICVLRK